MGADFVQHMKGQKTMTTSYSETSLAGGLGAIAGTLGTRISDSLIISFSFGIFGAAIGLLLFKIILFLAKSHKSADIFVFSWLFSYLFLMAPISIVDGADISADDNIILSLKYFSLFIVPLFFSVGVPCAITLCYNSNTLHEMKNLSLFYLAPLFLCIVLSFFSDNMNISNIVRWNTLIWAVVNGLFLIAALQVKNAASPRK